MSYLPALGTTYVSMTHFKIDVYAKAAEAQESVYPQAADNRNICRFVCPLPAQDFRGSTIKCKFGVACLRIDETYEVGYRRSDHTCVHGGTEPSIESKMEMLGEVDLERSKLLAGAKKKDKKGTSKSNKKGKSKKNREGTGGKGNDRQANAKPDENFKNSPRDTEPSTYRKRQRFPRRKFHTMKKRFPTSEVLQDQIDQLKTTAVALPSADESFPTQEALLVRLFAWSQLHGIMLRCVISTATPTRKSLKCYHNHPDWQHVGSGQCPVTYTIVENQDGTQSWSMVHPVQGHTHPIIVDSIAHASTTASNSLTRSAGSDLPRSGNLASIDSHTSSKRKLDDSEEIVSKTGKVRRCSGTGKDDRCEEENGSGSPSIALSPSTEMFTSGSSALELEEENEMIQE
ncbi:uncharacterized protein JCM6883_002862 [Sporobolomyces salmoneus]|uniref:uncharacterized protein n=1 Tax=Sporobolomyces salmoneus TaxID=183962 RepID=UPI0031719C7C